MKKSILFYLVILLVLFYVIQDTAFLNFKHYAPSKTIFISTHWKQMGGFEAATPDHMRLGCWSTALAQITRFQQLRPYGHVQYTTSKGYAINEIFDSTHYDFNLLADRIDSTTSPEKKQALAAYNYAAAAIMEKDFGTGSYMHLLASTGQLEAHYRVHSSRYISWQGLVPCTSGKLFDVVQEEISAGRPLLFHFANLNGFGHAVVIDGYQKKNGKQMVHLNQGQGGPQDGWYDFNEDILTAGDRKLRVIYTIQP